MRSVADLVAARRGDQNVGLRFEDSSWSWDEVVTEASVRAAMLLDRLGLSGRSASSGRSGPLAPLHVGVLLDNEPEFFFLLAGAALAGVTIVGINPTRGAAEIARDISHTDCRVLVSSPAYSAAIEQLDFEGDRLVTESSAYEEHLEEMKSSKAASSCLDAPAEIAATTQYLLLFTSGSTGAPKAVRFSQRRMAEAACAMAAGASFGAGQVLYGSMPMFHGNAMSSCVLPALASGATLVLRRRFSASGFLPDVRHFGITYFNYVGRALGYILATPHRDDDAQNTLRLAFGTEASPADRRAFRERFRCLVVEGYGSSEGSISMTRGPGSPPQSLGRPPADCDVVVVDPKSLEECPPAHFDGAGRISNLEEAVGEIVRRDGAALFEGYYKNDEADKERTRNGWFWSGDLGYRDEDGYFYFAGRPDDRLRVDGENFAAAPVERILARFPGVATVAVYPVPDIRSGDQVMATIELAPGATFDVEAFERFVSDQEDLAPKWVPRFVRIGVVPVTATGKVDKAPLRSEAWRSSDSLWWRPGRSAALVAMSRADAGELDHELETHGRSSLLGSR